MLIQTIKRKAINFKGERFEVRLPLSAPQNYRRAFGGRPPSRWPNSLTGGKRIKDVARRFEAWALDWKEPVPCPIIMWYSYWHRSKGGSLALTTEYGTAYVLWLTNANLPSNTPPSTLVFLHQGPGRRCSELARLEIDSLGRLWHSTGRSQLEWKRTPDNEWDNFGFIFLLTLVHSRQVALGLTNMYPVAKKSEDLDNFEIPSFLYRQPSAVDNPIA